jgi:hypothetical protein
MPDNAEPTVRVERVEWAVRSPNGGVYPFPDERQARGFYKHLNTPNAVQGYKVVRRETRVTPWEAVEP